ncbi:hypothetical protein K505DRAFT_415866 [Melanomma pulvis-pyrius CBS 109.77]|uniref:Uncharacterized protein n=1 Tax=Melanomma pulvis-pyrius CBS 109.77 TaxID=1314802 RepID=A0A6A6XIK2_9PLEO|nr:hypothetical protein K505DRAFT_415866 [Melanomma pulvis-pyrius CBS 109.77]
MAGTGTLTEDECASLLSEHSVLATALRITKHDTPNNNTSPSVVEPRLTPLLKAYQEQVAAAGRAEICIPVLSRAAAYLLAHRAHVLARDAPPGGLADAHVDGFLLDFCTEYTLEVGHGRGGDDDEPGILPFSMDVPVESFAQRWRLEGGGAGVFEVERGERECVFTLGDLGDLARLVPVASGNVTVHAPFA